MCTDCPSLSQVAKSHVYITSKITTLNKKKAEVVEKG